MANPKNFKVKYMIAQRDHWQAQIKRLAGNRSKIKDWQYAKDNLAVVTEIIKDLELMDQVSRQMKAAAPDYEAMDMIEGAPAGPEATQ